ncbi:hypothetical protein SAMN04487972_1152 [Paracoccus halophilus]|uniref:Uncharacterized protein n=1 Tax=Paracoccus halophilus TaxID=376733 RepID=A0A099F0T8_9RHOB|nr:hypothetical protein [Paracoccus halophilus]KGJ03866.1 hypothetical protein IT41_12190 [Paracoccus halophilus]SFA56316.1 hypothetical protein SAMN04487972_1152 [Paracoccus halophilus]
MKIVYPLILGSLLAAPAVAQGDRALIDRATLDKTIETLALTDADPRTSDRRRGPDLRGRLPGGTMVEIDFHRDGTLEEIEVGGSDLAPVSEVRAILPDILLNAERFPVDGRFEKIELESDGFEFEGVDAQGNWVEAEYAPNGELRDWETE